MHFFRIEFCVGYASSHRVHNEFAGGNLFFIKLLTIYYSIIKVSTTSLSFARMERGESATLPNHKELGGI